MYIITSSPSTSPKKRVEFKSITFSIYNFVCKLKKTIYGLKQAPRAWINTLKYFLLQLGFHNLRVDSSLFFRNYTSDIMFLLAYIDDIIITRSDEITIQNLILHYIIGFP